jgi:hypothetical protein
MKLSAFLLQKFHLPGELFGTSRKQAPKQRQELLALPYELRFKIQLSLSAREASGTVREQARIQGEEHETQRTSLH